MRDKHDENGDHFLLHIVSPEGHTDPSDADLTPMSRSGTLRQRRCKIPVADWSPTIEGIAGLLTAGMGPFFHSLRFGDVGIGPIEQGESRHFIPVRTR
jgi:hypothetical protein